MRGLLYILLLIQSLFVSAQKINTHHSAIIGSYGVFFPDKSKLGTIYPEGMNSNLKAPLPFVSLSLEHPRDYYNRKSFGAEMGLTYYFYQTQNNGDSLQYNWFANSWFWNIKYDILPKTDLINVLPYIGLQVGAQRVLINKQTAYKNTNVVVTPGLELQVQPLTRLVIGAKAAYLYDFTRPVWKRRQGTHEAAFESSRFTGFILSAHLFFCIW